MFTNKIRPRQCNTDHRRKTSDAVDVAQVGVLDVEAGGFHSSEACLNLPSLFVSGNGLFGAVITNQNLQFRHAIGVFQQGSGNIDTYDTLLASSDLIRNFRNGIMHTIPIASNVKVFKHINWTNSINYTERWYTNSISKTYNPQTDMVDKDTVYGFIANRTANFTSSLNTRLYGMFSFKKGAIKAFRHVLNPSLSFNYTPDFSQPSLGFYDFYTDRSGKRVYYSKTAL